MKRRRRIYNRIKVVMVEKRKSREEIANHIDKDERTVTRYLTNEVQPPVPVLFQLAEFFGCEVGDLLVSVSAPPIYVAD